MPLKIYSLEGVLFTQDTVSSINPKLSQSFGIGSGNLRASSAFDWAPDSPRLFIQGLGADWASADGTTISTRVASIYGGPYGSEVLSDLNGRATIGNWVANNFSDRDGVSFCGTLADGSLAAPYLVAGIARMRGPVNDNRFLALRPFDETVAPDSWLIEIHHDGGVAGKSSLARIIMFAGNGIERGKTAIVCSDEGDNYYAAMAGFDRARNNYAHPVHLAAAVTEGQASGNDVESFVFSGRCLTSGIRNTPLPCLRPRLGVIDWGAVRKLPFVSRAELTLDPKHSDFEHPDRERIYTTAVNGLGSAVSQLSDKESYASYASESFWEADGTTSAKLSRSDISFVELDVTAESNLTSALTPDAATMPIALPSAQGVFIVAGKAIAGTSVRFDPWSSNTFSSPVTSFGRNVLEIPNPLEPSSTALSFLLPRNDVPGQNIEGVRWDAIGDALLPIERTDAGIVGGSATRLYNSRRYFGLSRSTGAVGTYSANSAWDEAGYLAGAACSALLSGVGHIATASEQSPPIPPGTTFVPDASVNLRYPVKGALTAASSYKPSLAGRTFSCVADAVDGVPFTAGTFRYRGAGATASVSIAQAMQGTIEAIDYPSPLPSFSENQTQIRVTYTASNFVYDATASHVVTMTTTFVDLVVKWFVSLQGPGSFDPLFSLFSEQGANVDNLRGRVSLSHLIRNDSIDGVRPCLMAQVWARAIGKISINSDYSMPEIFGISGNYPAFARAWDAPYGEHAFPNAGDSTPGSIFGPVYSIEDVTALAGVSSDSVSGSLVPGNAFRKDASFATWQDVALVNMGEFPFDGAQTESLLAGNEVTATRWDNAQFAGDPLALSPRVAAWHNDTFGTYKLTFSLNFA